MRSARPLLVLVIAAALVDSATASAVAPTPVTPLRQSQTNRSKNSLRAIAAIRQLDPQRQRKKEVGVVVVPGLWCGVDAGREATACSRRVCTDTQHCASASDASKREQISVALAPVFSSVEVLKHLLRFNMRDGGLCKAKHATTSARCASHRDLLSSVCAQSGFFFP